MIQLWQNNENGQNTLLWQGEQFSDEMFLALAEAIRDGHEVALDGLAPSFRRIEFFPRHGNDYDTGYSLGSDVWFFRELCKAMQSGALMAGNP